MIKRSKKAGFCRLSSTDEKPGVDEGEQNDRHSQTMSWQINGVHVELTKPPSPESNVSPGKKVLDL
jgi:hypothetical protein